MKCPSYGFADAARMRTRTLSSLTLGTSMSLSSRTSGDPYLSQTMAFIASSSLGAAHGAVWSMPHVGVSEGIRCTEGAMYLFKTRPSQPREHRSALLE